MIGTQILTYEKLNTLVIQIEGTLNSRPLVSLTGTPEDINVMTPGHFLVGSSLTSLPENTQMETPLYHLKHWHLVQAMHDHVWLRWSRE